MYKIDAYINVLKMHKMFKPGVKQNAGSGWLWVVRFLWSPFAPLFFSVSFSMMNMHSFYNYNKKKT